MSNFESLTFTSILHPACALLIGTSHRRMGLRKIDFQRSMPQLLRASCSSGWRGSTGAVPSAKQSSVGFHLAPDTIPTRVLSCRISYASLSPEATWPEGFFSFASQLSETFRWPQPPVLLQKYCVQMGGVLPYNWEAYCSTNGRRTAGFPFLRSLEARKVRRYKWGAYCRTNWGCTAVLFRQVVGVGVSETLPINLRGVPVCKRAQTLSGHICQQSSLQIHLHNHSAWVFL